MSLFDTLADITSDGKKPSKPQPGEPCIIPAPASLKRTSGMMPLKDAAIRCEGDGAEQAWQSISDIVHRAAGAPISPSGTGATVSFAIDSALTGKLGTEGYTLSITPKGLTARAATSAGLFYAAQSIRQLLPPSAEKGPLGTPASLPCLEIEDSPRFPWRGLMIDSARHFFPVATILKFVDIMALYKFNRLHLHLIDDQGWRLELLTMPELTAKGSSRRKSTPLEFPFGAGPAHSGHYTQTEIRAIIAHAAARHITVIPEIEMPGHSQSAFPSHPEITCTRGRFDVRTRWGINKDIMCAGSDETFAFIEKVLAETVEIFPSEYIHIGGDEAPKDRWKSCPRCQERIKHENLRDEHGLQSWFIRRVEDYLHILGRKLIGWDEILEGGLPPRATVMSWRGTSGGIKAAKQGHKVIMCPTSHCYFDYRQALLGEPMSMIGPPLSIRRVYSFDPVPAELRGTPGADCVLGTQANLWSEMIATTRHLEYMAFPRALAVAETAWSPVAAKDFDSFSTRTQPALERLAALDVNFRRPRYK